jgi:hypothetical protein
MTAKELMQVLALYDPETEIIMLNADNHPVYIDNIAFGKIAHDDTENRLLLMDRWTNFITKD